MYLGIGKRLLLSFHYHTSDCSALYTMYWVNLTGESIRFVTFESLGIIDLDRIETNRVTVTGIGVHIQECLQLILSYTVAPYNFSRHSFDMPDTINHTPVVNTFNPVVLTNPAAILAETPNASLAALQNNQADVGLGLFYILSSRSRIADALLPLSDENFRLYFLQPDFTQFDNPFNRQFSSNLAMTYLAIMVISGVLLAFLVTINGFDLLGESFRDFCRSLYDFIFWNIGAWCQHDADISVGELPVWQIRLVKTLLSALSNLLYNVYCAVILVTLTMNLVSVRNVEQLLLYKYTFFAYGDTKDMLLNPNQQALAWMPTVPLPPSNVEVESVMEYQSKLSITRLVQTRHAHLSTDDLFMLTLDDIMSSHFGGTENNSKPLKICEKLSSFPVRGGSLQSGLYVRKGFKFRHEFNFALRETGINLRLMGIYRNFVNRNRRCQDTSKGGAFQETLGMAYLGSMFKVLAVFSMLAVSVCCMENANCR